MHSERIVENYFNYFTEIEEHFQKRRGTGLLLSTLDWALIEMWKEAGIALEAVLRGIDATFDKYDRRPSKTRKVNSLAYCSQEVLAAAEDMKEAAVGAAPKSTAAGIEAGEIVAFLERCAAELERAGAKNGGGDHAQKAIQALMAESAHKLRELSGEMGRDKAPARLEDLERRLSVMEENCSPHCWAPLRMKSW